MYQYLWDEETGGLLLTTEQSKFSKEPRPVYASELTILGFDQYWLYPKDDCAPLMWAEANSYIYRGRLVAKTKGGALYTAPELIILDEPEPKSTSLKFVDIERMVVKNRAIMESLAQETIQKVYNTYISYRKKVNLFYVAFSGGKDSIVALDLVQRALPHNDFKVLFGNTNMEFPTTLTLAKEVKQYCEDEGISFYEAKADFPATQSWDQFGPPARKVRWCCTVHKTAPVINKLCEIYGLDKLHAMMITGVRGDESPARSDYDELSFGKKLAGQYSYHPILDWSSAEVYLHIYGQHLPMNGAYKYGFNRVGCIMCPNSSEKHEYIKRRFFQDEVDKFCDIIVRTSKKDLSGNNAKDFLETGGWKTRLTGRELKFSEEERFKFEERKDSLIFIVTNLKSDWIEWYKVIGEMDNNAPHFLLEYEGVWRKCELTTEGNITTFTIQYQGRTKNSIEFIYLFKSVLAKSQYCIRCMTCVAECPHRNISMKGDSVHISDKCVRCRACLKILSGCLYYNSVKGSRDMQNVKGINRYLSVGVDAEWVRYYLEDQSYEPGNRKTDTMFSFLDDAGITKKRKLMSFGEKIIEMGINTEATWALMLCNLVDSAPFRWYVENIPFDQFYEAAQLDLDMEEATKKARGEFWNSFKVILGSNEILQQIGLGRPDITSKTNKNGEVKKTMNYLQRVYWENPDARVILYSLYKFAEKCGGYYQFSLSTLLDDSIERDGISPTRIFGLNYDTMVPILNGLSVNYSDFISASFSLGLDTISLREDKSSQDVLTIF